MSQGPAARLGPPRKLDEAAYVAHLDGVRRGLETWGRERDAAGRAKRIFIFIHGGLNPYGYSLERARQLAEPILDDEYYPVFLNWDSSLTSSYVDHLLWVRQGKDYGWAGLVLLPAPLMQDLLGTVAHAPLVWWASVNAALRRIPGAITPEEILFEKRIRLDLESIGESLGLTTRKTPTTAQRIRREAIAAYAQEVDVGRDQRTWSEVARQQALWVATFPTQFALGPLLSSLGSSAWEEMERRVRLLFYTQAQFEAAKGGPLPGGVPRLMRLLRELQDRDPSWEIVLAAHSMGTIVASGVLGLPEPPEFSHIVYMAAADGVGSTAVAMSRYLEDRPDTRCHFLTLHEDAESAETMGWGIPPHGSLLVWLDGFLNTPRTPLDLTAGRFGHALLMRGGLSEHALAQCNVKAFSVGRRAPAGNPQTHAEFGELPFWKSSFWLPAAHPPDAPLHF